MKSDGKARNNGLYRHIRTSKEIIRNLLNDYIKIIVVVPFIGYDSKWPDQSKHRLKKLIQNANDSIVISHSADVSSYKKRNYYMVDHAEYLIGVFDNQKKLRSGTAQTVNYALHQGKAITLIHPDTMEITTPTT